MKRLRSKFIFTALGVVLVAAISAGFIEGTGAGAVKVSDAAKGTTITVTAGKPSEFGFKLSKFSNVPVGPVTFKVTDKGVAFHDFKICLAPTTSASKNACAGKATATLHPGQTATLTVTLKKGTYEFLCSLSGHAAAGMKGLIGIGVVVKSEPVTAPPKTTTTTKTTTTPAGGGGATTTTKTTTTTPGGGGGGINQSGCVPGVTIQTSGNSDADGDETGAEADDGDGCI